MAENAYYTKLENRGLLRLSGPDTRNFLQGLISNDVNLLDTQPLVYACLLNAQGKFLHDFFLSEKDGTILIDCEGGERAKDLFKRLSIYKLRADVKIELIEKNSVYVGLGSWGAMDPRGFGVRAFDQPDVKQKPFDVWDKTRIELCIPDGSRDMIPEKSTLMESNLDLLNGISFDKGCYIGQELTARMHYRALVKKRLQTVNINELPEGAELRSTCGDVGIALVKISSE